MKKLNFILLIACLLIRGVDADTSTRPEKKTKQLPIITQLSRETSTLEGGELVTIIGNNLLATTQLFLGDSKITDFSIKSDKKIVFRVPLEKFPGVRTLTLQTEDGLTQHRFEITAKPVTELSGVGITTLAGGISFVGDGDKATGSTVVLSLNYMSLDEGGNLFIADADFGRIRRVDRQSNIITTVAGNGSNIFEGKKVTAQTIGFSPTSVATDKDGNIFVVEAKLYRVRKIDMHTGKITTVAGNGLPGFTGDNGMAVNARLWNPGKVITDKAGNLFICDQGGLVRRIDARTGIITTVAGDGGSFFDPKEIADNIPATESAINPYGIAINDKGDLYIVDRVLNRVRKVSAATGLITTIAGNSMSGFSGDGGPATLATLNDPLDVAVDDKDNVFIADSGNGRIRRVNASDGVISTVAGNGLGDSKDGSLAKDANLTPSLISVDKEGSLFIGETSYGRVRKVDLQSGIITTVAANSPQSNCGDGKPAISARLARPTNATTDSAGNIYFVDADNFRVRRIDATTNIITTVAGTGISGSDADGLLATSARLIQPTSVAIDKDNNIFIADRNKIKKVDTHGILTTIAGKGQGFFGDGMPAIDAGFSSILFLTFNRAGNLLISDFGNSRIRMINMQTTIVSTIAGDGRQIFQGDNDFAFRASIKFPSNIFVDENDNLFIVDRGNNRIRKVDGQTGIITTLAGNGKSSMVEQGSSALTASIGDPASLLVDRGGNMFISDALNNIISRVDARTGIITIIAGNGKKGFSGDGALATKASINVPIGLIMDKDSNLIIFDSNNNALRLVRAVTKNITNN